MKLKELYRLAVEMGIAADPRGKEAVADCLAKKQKEYKKLKEEDQEFFDPESLTNPYADTRILLGEEDREVKTILAGIDIEAGEVAVAQALNTQGAKIDLLLSHHPEGAALAALPEVMHLQTGYMAQYGMLPNVAEAIMSERIGEVSRSIGVSNHFRAVDAARLFGFAFLCVHTPADNLVTQLLYENIEQEQPQTLEALVNVIRKIPEYHTASKNYIKTLIASGSPDRSVGKVYVDFTGGTTGPKDAYAMLAERGVSTVIAMYASEKMIEAAKEKHLNLVIAGHMASDSIGLNRFLDKIEARGVAIIPTSGLIRVKR